MDNQHKQIAKQNKENDLGFRGNKSYEKPNESMGARERLLNKTKHALKKTKEVIEIVEEVVEETKVVLENAVCYLLNRNSNKKKWIVKFFTGEVKFINYDDFKVQYGLH